MGINESHRRMLPLSPQRAAVAVALVKSGKGQVKITGCPIELIEPGHESNTAPRNSVGRPRARVRISA